MKVHRIEPSRCRNCGWILQTREWMGPYGFCVNKKCGQRLRDQLLDRSAEVAAPTKREGPP